MNIIFTKYQNLFEKTGFRRIYTFQEFNVFKYLAILANPSRNVLFECCALFHVQQYQQISNSSRNMSR